MNTNQTESSFDRKHIAIPVFPQLSVRFFVLFLGFFLVVMRNSGLLNIPFASHQLTLVRFNLLHFVSCQDHFTYFKGYHLKQKREEIDKEKVFFDLNLIALYPTCRSEAHWRMMPLTFTFGSSIQTRTASMFNKVFSQ